MNKKLQSIILFLACFMPLALTAQSNHWTPQSANYEDNTTLTGVIQINGVEQMTTDLEVGAFCGEECRGSVRPLYFPPTQRYIVQLTIFGENGDQITFKLYDHAQGIELDLQSPDAITFGSSGLGTLMEPYVLNFADFIIEYTISASANPISGGTITGAGNYIPGATVTLTANPNLRYEFVNWKEGDSVVSTNPNYSFTATANRNLEAIFQRCNYDFSAVCSTGQTLYYKISDNNTHTVYLTYPNYSSGDYWYGYQKPTGDIVLPSSVEHDGILYSVTSIGDDAFEGCSGFTGSLNIPESVTSIGNYAFYGCSGFTGSLNIPESVTSIGIRAFSGCSGFTGSLNIPESVTSIGHYAFYGCSGFTGSLNIPESVTSICNFAFYGCSGLTSIISKATTPPTAGAGCFGLVPISILVQVPCGSAEAYRQAAQWSNFSNYSEDIFIDIIIAPSDETFGSVAIVKEANCEDSEVIVQATPNEGYVFVNWTKDGNIVSTDAAYTFTVTEDIALVANFMVMPSEFVFIGSSSDHYWSTASNWRVGIVPTIITNVTINGECNLDVNANVASLTINDEASLTISNGKMLSVTELVSDDPSNLIIEDGGQLFTQTTNQVFATMKKDIMAYSEANENWYLVSSPAYALSQRRIRTNATGMLSGTYDLYSFDMTMPEEEWQNYKDYAFIYLYVGNGYLYAHQPNTTLEFAGILVTTASETFDLNFNSSEPEKNFNLIGNPYPCNANVNRTYYRLGDDHKTLVEGSGPIKPCEAVFVKANGPNETVTFTQAVD